MRLYAAWVLYSVCLPAPGLPGGDPTLVGAPFCFIRREKRLPEVIYLHVFFWKGGWFEDGGCNQFVGGGMDGRAHGWMGWVFFVPDGAYLTSGWQFIVPLSFSR